MRSVRGRRTPTASSSIGRSKTMPSTRWARHGWGPWLGGRIVCCCVVEEWSFALGLAGESVVLVWPAIERTTAGVTFYEPQIPFSRLAFIAMVDFRELGGGHIPLTPARLGLVASR